MSSPSSANPSTIASSSGETPGSHSNITTDAGLGRTLRVGDGQLPLAESGRPAPRAS
ncbi:MAG: hypothetical protein QM747_04285 [Nocardioides sp.]